MNTSWIIFDSVLTASFSVLVICGVGSLMYRSKHINSDFTKQLSGLIERIFLPSLIVTNFIKAVFLEQIQQVLPVIIAAISVCAIGYIVGYLSNKYWIKDDKYEQIVLLACANPHTTNIQLQVCYGLQYLLADLTKYRGYETETDAGTRAITSIMIFTAVNNTLRWTFGKQILLKFAQQEKEFKLLSGVPLEDFSNRRDESKLQEKSSSPLLNLKTQIEETYLSKYTKHLSMPLIAILIAFIIVLIPPLQSNLIDSSSSLNRAIYSPFYTIGRATPSCVLVMLGANIYSIVERGGFRDDDTISKRTLIMITITRLIILPTVGFIVVIVMTFFKFLSDPTDIFVTFVTFASPSAINIIVQAKQYTESEDIVSVILMYSYLSAIISLPLWSMFFFYIMFNNQI